MDQVSDNTTEVAIPAEVFLPVCVFVVAVSGFLVKMLCDTWENTENLSSFNQSDDDSTDVDQPFSGRWEGGGTNFVNHDVKCDVHERRRRVLEWSITSWSSVGSKPLSEITLEKLKIGENKYSMDDIAVHDSSMHDPTKTQQHKYGIIQNEVSSYQNDRFLKLNDARLIPQNSCTLLEWLRMQDTFPYYHQEFLQSTDGLVNGSPTESSRTTLEASRGVSNFSSENDINSDITKRMQNTQTCRYETANPSTFLGNVPSIHYDDTSLDAIKVCGTEENLFHNVWQNKSESTHGKNVDGVNKKSILEENQEQFLIFNNQFGTSAFNEIEKSAERRKLSLGLHVSIESSNRIYTSPSLQTHQITLNVQPSHYASKLQSQIKEFSSDSLSGQRSDELLSTEMISSPGFVGLPSNKEEINPGGLVLNLNNKDEAISACKKIDNNDDIAVVSASNLKQHQLHSICSDIVDDGLQKSSQSVNAMPEVRGKPGGCGVLKGTDEVNHGRRDEQGGGCNAKELPRLNGGICEKEADCYGKANVLRPHLLESVPWTQRGGERHHAPLISVTPRVLLGGKIFCVQIFGRNSSSLQKETSLHSKFPKLVINRLSTKSDHFNGIDTFQEDFSIYKETLTPYFIFGKEVLRVKITETTPEKRNEGSAKQYHLGQEDFVSLNQEYAISCPEKNRLVTPNIVIESPELETTRMCNPLVVIDGTLFKPFALQTRSAGQTRKKEETLPGVLVPVNEEKSSNLEGSSYLGHLDTFTPLLSLSGNLYRILVPRGLLAEKQWSEFLLTPSNLPGLIVPIRKGVLEKSCTPRRKAKTEKEKSNKSLTIHIKDKHRKDLNGPSRQAVETQSNQIEYLHLPVKSSEPHSSTEGHKFQNFRGNFSTGRLNNEKQIQNAQLIARLNECHANTRVFNGDSSTGVEQNGKSEECTVSPYFHPYHVILGNDIYKIRVFQPPPEGGNPRILHGLLTSITSLNGNKEKLGKESLSEKQQIQTSETKHSRSDEARTKSLPKSIVSVTEEGYVSYYPSHSLVADESPSRNIPFRKDFDLSQNPLGYKTARVIQCESAKRASESQNEKFVRSTNGPNATTPRFSTEKKQVISSSKDEYRNILESESYEDLCSAKENCRRKAFEIVKVIPQRRKGSYGKKWYFKSLERIEEEEYEGDDHTVTNTENHETSLKICETFSAPNKQSYSQRVIRTQHEPRGACKFSYYNCCSKSVQRLSVHDILHEQKNEFIFNDTSEEVERAKGKNSNRNCDLLKSPTITEKCMVTYYLLNTHERMTKAVSNGTINTDRHSVQSPQCTTTTASYSLEAYQTTPDVCTASIKEKHCCTSFCQEINHQNAVSWRKRKDVNSARSFGALIYENFSDDYADEGSNKLYLEEGVTDNVHVDTSLSNDSVCNQIHNTQDGRCEHTLEEFGFLDDSETDQFETDEGVGLETLPKDLINCIGNASDTVTTRTSELPNMDSTKKQKSKKKEKTLDVPVSDPNQLRFAKIGNKRVVIVRDPKVMEAEQLKALKKAQQKKKPKGRRIKLAGDLDDDRLSVRSLPPQVSSQSMRRIPRQSPRPGSPTSLPAAELMRGYDTRRSLPPNLRAKSRHDSTGPYKSREEIYPRERSNTGPPGTGLPPRRTMSLPDNSNYQHKVLAEDRFDGPTKNRKQIYDVPRNHTNVGLQNYGPGRSHPNNYGSDGKHTYSLPRTKLHDSKYGTYHSDRGAPSKYNANQSRNSGSLPPRLPVRQGQESTMNRNANGRNVKIDRSMGKNYPSNHKYQSRTDGYNSEEYAKHYGRRALDPRSKNLSGSTGNFHAKPEVNMGSKAASLHDVANLNAERHKPPIETNVLINSVDQPQTRPSRSDHSERGSSDENSVFLHDYHSHSKTEGAAHESVDENELKTIGANSIVKVETCFYWEPGFETKLEKEKKKEREEIMETEITGVFTRGTIDSAHSDVSGNVDRQSFRNMQNKDLRTLALMQEKIVGDRQKVQSVPRDTNRPVASSQNKYRSQNELVKSDNQENIYAQPRARSASDMKKEWPSQGKTLGNIPKTEKLTNANHRLGFNSSKDAQSFTPASSNSDDVPHASAKETTFGVPTAVENFNSAGNEISTRERNSTEPSGKHRKMETTFGEPNFSSEEKPEQKETSFYEPQMGVEKFKEDVKHARPIVSNPKQSSNKGIPKWQLPGLAEVNGGSRQEQRVSSIGSRKETSLSQSLRKETVLDGNASKVGNSAKGIPGVINANRPQIKPNKPTSATQANKPLDNKRFVPQRKETSFSTPQEVGSIPVENRQLLVPNNANRNVPVRNVVNRPPYPNKHVLTKNTINQEMSKPGFTVQRKETSFTEPERSRAEDDHYSQRREYEPVRVNGTPEPKINPKTLETSSSSREKHASITNPPANQQRNDSSTRVGLQSAMVLAISSDGEPSEDTDSSSESFDKKSDDGSDEERNTIKPSRYGAVRDATTDEESNAPKVFQEDDIQYMSPTEMHNTDIDMFTEETEDSFPEQEETFFPSRFGAVRASEKQVPKPAPKPRPRVTPKEVITETRKTQVELSHEEPKSDAKLNVVDKPDQVQSIAKEDKDNKYLPPAKVDKEQSDLDKSAQVSRKPFSTAFCLRGVKVQKTVIPLTKSTGVDDNCGYDNSSVISQPDGRETKTFRRHEELVPPNSQVTDGDQAEKYKEEQQLISPLSISGSSATTITEPDSDKEDEVPGTQKLEIPIPVEDGNERVKFYSRNDRKQGRPIPSPRAPLSIKPFESESAFGFEKLDIPSDLPPPPEYSDMERETISLVKESKASEPLASSVAPERSILHDGINQENVVDHQEVVTPAEQPVTYSYKPSYSDVNGVYKSPVVTPEDNIEVKSNRYSQENTADDTSVPEYQQIATNSMGNSVSNFQNRVYSDTLFASQSSHWAGNNVELGGDTASDDNAFVQNRDAGWFPKPHQQSLSDDHSNYQHLRHQNQKWDENDFDGDQNNAHNDCGSHDGDLSREVLYYYSPGEGEVDYESKSSKGATMYYPAEMADEDLGDGNMAYSDTLRSSSMGLASYMHFEDLQVNDNRDMRSSAGTLYIPDFGDDYDDDYDDEVEVGDTALRYYPEHDFMEPIFQRLETIPEEMEPWSDATSEYSDEDVSSTEEGDVTVNDKTIDTFSSVAPAPANVERVFLPDAMTAEVGSGVDSESLSNTAATALYYSEGDVTELAESETQDKYTDKSESDDEALRVSDNSAAVVETEGGKKATDPDYLFPSTDDIKVPASSPSARLTENVIKEKTTEDNDSENDAFIMEDDNYDDENESGADEQSEPNECKGTVSLEQSDEGLKPPPSRSFVIALVAQTSVVQRGNAYPVTELQQNVASVSANERHNKAPPPLAEEEDISEADEDAPVSYAVHESPVRIISPLKVNIPTEEEVIKTAEVIDQSTPTTKEREQVAVKERIPKSETELTVRYSPVPVKVIYSTTATPQKIEYPSKIAPTDVIPNIESADQEGEPESYPKVVPIQQAERTPTFIQVEHGETQRNPKTSNLERVQLPNLIQGEQKILSTNSPQSAAGRRRQISKDVNTECDSKDKVMPVQPSSVSPVSQQSTATPITSGEEKEVPDTEIPPKSKERSSKRKFRKIQGNHRAAIQDVIADLETNLGVEMSTESKQVNDASRTTVELDKQMDVDKSAEESKVQSIETEEQRAPNPKYSTDSLKQLVEPRGSQQPCKIADYGRTVEEPASASRISNFRPEKSQEEPKEKSWNRNLDSVPKQLVNSPPPSTKSGESEETGRRISAKPCPDFDFSGLNVKIPDYDSIFSQVKSQQPNPEATFQSLTSNGLDVAPALPQEPRGELLRTDSGEIDKQLERMRENLRQMSLPEWFRKSHQYEKLMTGDVRSLPSYWSYKAPRRLIASSPSTPTGLRKQYVTISTQLPFLTAASFRWKDSQNDGRVSPANSLPDSWTFTGLTVQTCGLSPNTSATPSPNPNRSPDVQEFNYSSSPQPEDRFSANSLYEVESTPLLTTTQVLTHSHPPEKVDSHPEPTEEIMEPTTDQRNDKDILTPPKHVVLPPGRSSGGSAVFCITSSMLMNTFTSPMPSNVEIDSSEHSSNNNNSNFSNSFSVSEHTDATADDQNCRRNQLDIPESGGDMSSSDEVFCQETMSYYNPSSNWVRQDFDQQRRYNYQTEEQSDEMQYYSMQI